MTLAELTTNIQGAYEAARALEVAPLGAVTTKLLLELVSAALRCCQGFKRLCDL